MKRAWRKFEATTGSEASAKARQWANTGSERGAAEFREFSDDTNKHIERAKPEIKAWIQTISSHAELLAHRISKGFSYATRGAVLILVLLGIIWLSGSLWDGVPISDQAVQNEEHQGGSGLVTNPDDEDWGDEIGRTPNDDRSDSLNPNNDAYQDSMDNRSDQMNPNNDAYRSSRQ
jgi:hypothetical protein